MKNPPSKMLGTAIRQLPKLLALTLFCSSAASALAGDAKQVEPPAPDIAEPWQFNLTLPSWLANTAGTMGLNGVNADFYIGAGSLIRHLDMAGSLSAEVRKGPYGVYGDFLYISASDGVATQGLIEKVDARLDLYLADLEINYRVLEGPKGYVDVRAGVRYTNLYNKVTIAPNDEAIDEASINLVNNVSTQIRQGLNDLDLVGQVDNAFEIRSKKLPGPNRPGLQKKRDLTDPIRTAIKDNIVSKLTALLGNRPNVPSAPVGGRVLGRLQEIVQGVVQDNAKDLAQALQDLREANSPARRAAAQEKVNSVKTQIAEDIAGELKSSLDTSFAVAQDWWDPYVGVSARYNFTDTFYLTAKGDIGGFGVGADLTWQAYGGLGYQLTKNIHTEIGYRYLYTDYNKDGFLYQVAQSGAQMSVGITF